MTTYGHGNPFGSIRDVTGEPAGFWTRGFEDVSDISWEIDGSPSGIWAVLVCRGACTDGDALVSREYVSQKCLPIKNGTTETVGCNE